MMHCLEDARQFERYTFSTYLIRSLGGYRTITFILTTCLAAYFSKLGMSKSKQSQDMAAWDFAEGKYSRVMTVFHYQFRNQLGIR